MEFMDPRVRIRGCDRTKVNFAYAWLGLDPLIKDEDRYPKIFGFTVQEVMSGEKCFPRGSHAAFEQIGRLIVEIGADADEKRQIMDVVQEAVENGCTWAEIKAHYRRLRLGNREGDVDGMKRAGLSAVAEYRKKFPKTSCETVAQALRDILDRVLAALEEEP